MVTELDRESEALILEERPGKPGAIEGVSTSTLCLIGFTLEGLDNEQLELMRTRLDPELMRTFGYTLP